RADGVAEWIVPRVATQPIPAGTKSVAVFADRTYPTNPQGLLVATITNAADAAGSVEGLPFDRAEHAADRSALRGRGSGDAAGADDRRCVRRPHVPDQRRRADRPSGDDGPDESAVGHARAAGLHLPAAETGRRIARQPRGPGVAVHLNTALVPEHDRTLGLRAGGVPGRRASGQAR